MTSLPAVDSVVVVSSNKSTASVVLSGEVAAARLASVVVVFRWSSPSLPAGENEEEEETVAPSGPAKANDGMRSAFLAST